MSEMRHPRVDVVVPALNEEHTIGQVLVQIPGWVRQVVVVDNGSTDRTAEIARAGGAKVVHEPRRGYGAACLAGLGALQQPDVVVFLDGDHSDHPQEMDRLVQPIAAGEADLVIGSRVLGEAERGALTLPQRFGNALASLLIRRIWHADCTDLGPFRAIRFDALQAVAMDDLDYGWTVQMQARALRLGLVVKEVPVSYRTRIGRSKISGTVRGVVGAGIKILSTIAREAIRRPRSPAPAEPSASTSATDPAEDADTPRLSVIIPTLNEAERLPSAIASADPSQQVEVIVADGGSTDQTARIAASLGACVVHTPPGRARQMNAGAAVARSPTLLFLHADTRLPFGYLNQVERLLARPGAVAGAFRLAFDQARPGLRLIEWAANWRARLLGLPYGDQALFLRRSTFQQVAGYRELPVMEDYDLVCRLRRSGRVTISSGFAITSSRRCLAQGTFRTTLTHQRMILGWHLGVPPARLARWRQDSVTH